MNDEIYRLDTSGLFKRHVSELDGDAVNIVRVMGRSSLFTALYPRFCSSVMIC